MTSLPAALKIAAAALDQSSEKLLEDVCRSARGSSRVLGLGLSDLDLHQLHRQRL